VHAPAVCAAAYVAGQAPVAAGVGHVCSVPSVAGVQTPCEHVMTVLQLRSTSSPYSQPTPASDTAHVEFAAGAVAGQGPAPGPPLLLPLPLPPLPLPLPLPPPSELPGPLAVLAPHAKHAKTSDAAA